ncbi:MAG: MotA/TolQ/ExbB proton channel family protein [Planctomycetes bacterium]|nr:MotA/TolQ/ExbB proton channel family protein [Planctomycetota bacterium]
MNRLLVCSLVVSVLFLGIGTAIVWSEDAPPGGGETAAPAGGGDTKPAAPEGGGGSPKKKPGEGGGMVEAAFGMTLWELMEAGGTVGYLIMALSVVGLGIVFENFYSLRRSVLMPRDIIDEVERLFQEENYEEALELCDAEQNLLTNMIGAGLSKIAGGYDAIMDSMGAALEEGATHLHQKINYLNLIANVGPMLGLLGTVQGMVMAFQQIAASGGAPKPSELADSISLALVTTLQGLIVAIPMVSFHMFLKNRVTKLVMEAAVTGNELMERFKGK